MAAIGYVTKQGDGSYKGQLNRPIKVGLQFVHNGSKSAEKHPDFRVYTADRVEIGAAWNRVGRTSGKEYVSVSLEGPEFGQRPVYANLGRAAGQEDPDVFALIWSPTD